MSPRSLLSALLISTSLAIATPALAEVQLSAYGGTNWNFDSKVKVDKGAVHDSRTVSWDGKPFEMPPYWGVRASWWQNKLTSWGLALDYTHQKAYANINFAADSVYDHLEFTDGNNIITLNAMYRWREMQSPWGFYVGGGPGLAFPHTEVELDAAPTQKTWEYQLTGLAAQALAGVEYRFAPSWTVFGEGKITYTHNDSDLSGGGTIKTDIWSPHLLAGVSYGF